MAVKRPGHGEAVKRSWHGGEADPVTAGGFSGATGVVRCGVDGAVAAAAVEVVTRARTAERSHGQSDSHSVALLCT